MRFWVSWEQSTEDYRPLTYPPEGMLGWWCSGEGDGYWTLCALLDAEDDDAAKDVIAKHWPETLEMDDWRFWNEVDADHAPGDRFPLPDWSPLLKKGEGDGVVE